MVAGSVVARLLAATQRALCESKTLPSPLDIEACIPPTRTAWVRRVTGKNLWLFYVFDDYTVIALHVVKEPPVPILH